MGQTIPADENPASPAVQGRNARAGLRPLYGEFDAFIQEHDRLGKGGDVLQRLQKRKREIFSVIFIASADRPSRQDDRRPAENGVRRLRR